MGMRFWVFNEDTCHFDVAREPSAMAAKARGIPIVIDDGNDLYHVMDDGVQRRWDGDEPWVVAGLTFDREDFESL